VREGIEVRLGGSREGLPADLGLDRGVWHEVALDAVPYPVLVRLAEDGAGRLLIDGLVFGASRSDQPAEITSGHLRLPLAAVVEQCARIQGLADHPHRFIAALAADAAVTSRRVRRPRLRPGGGPPTDRELRDFARVYLGYVTDPATSRRPMSATARRLAMSRATAHRWHTRAVEAGLLPRPANRPTAARHQED